MSISYRDYDRLPMTYEYRLCKLRHIPCRADAEVILGKLRNIAELYGDVRVEDLLDISGVPHNYSKTNREHGWKKEALKSVVIYRTRDAYEISFPVPILLTGNLENNSIENHPTTEKEPLCITIHINDLNDPDAVLADVFKHIYTIKDRMVNVTIM